MEKEEDYCMLSLYMSLHVEWAQKLQNTLINGLQKIYSFDFKQHPVRVS